MGRDHPVACRRQQGRDIDEAVNVVWPPVQEDDCRPVSRTGIDISDIEVAGVDLLEGAKRRVGASRRLIFRPTLRPRRTDHAQFGRGKRHGGPAQKAAAMKIRRFEDVSFVHFRLSEFGARW